jgi:hypothetical protein
MLSRTDAAARWFSALALCLALGCASLPSQSTYPPQPATPLPTPPPQPHTVAAVPLAITTPGAEPSSGVTPATFRQDEKTPGNDAPRPTDLEQIRRLATEAAQQYASIHSYIARLRRREVVNGREKPEEVLMFKHRRQPWSIHFKWLSDEGKGREVVYVKGQYEDKLHVLTAAGDIPFMGAGHRLDLDPNSPMVRAANRHHITEAGIGNNIQTFAARLDAVASGKAPGMTLKYLGPTPRPEYPVPLEGVECRVPPGRDADLPNGGIIQTYFDPDTKFPVLYLIYDPSGRQLEYDCYDRFQLGVRLDDDDFNPDKLWGRRP